jgi:hypothetical protein
MAQNKKSFLLYCDILSTIGKLPDEQAGKLFKIILEYVNDKDPKIDDLLLEIAFEPIKQQLKRDLKKYESAKEDKSSSGQLGNLKRWHSELYSKVLSKEIPLDEAIRLSQNIASAIIPSQPIANVAVNVNVNDIDNDIDNVKLKKQTPSKLVAVPKTDFIDSIVNSFSAIHNYEVINRGKERSAAGKLLNIYKKKYPNSTGEETIDALSAYFTACLNINDAWLKDNMSLSIIVSKFNEINKKLKNGNKPTPSKGGATAIELAEITARHFGAK